MELNDKNYEELTEEERRAARTALFDYLACLLMEEEFEETDEESPEEV